MTASFAWTDHEVRAALALDPGEGRGNTYAGISTDSEATVTEDLRSGLRKGADGRRSQFGAGITPHAVGSEGQRHGIIIGRRPPKAMDRREA